MIDDIRCADCEWELLGYVDDPPLPVWRDACPECGGTSFEEIPE